MIGPHLLLWPYLLSLPVELDDPAILNNLWFPKYNMPIQHVHAFTSALSSVWTPASNHLSSLGNFLVILQNPDWVSPLL